MARRFGKVRLFCISMFVISCQYFPARKAKKLRVSGKTPAAMIGYMLMKLVSLNIERDRHLKSRVVPFFERVGPDVICLQEIFEVDFKDLRARFGGGIYASMTKKPSVRPDRGGTALPWGVGILSRAPMRAAYARYYYGNSDDEILEFERMPDGNIKQETVKKALLWASISVGGELFTIGTTHFTWTPDGNADGDQRRDADALLAALKKIPDIVWCGDLNAPRGREIFTKFAAEYRDHIPAQYTTSIDAKFHRKRGLELMVDGLFSTPQYDVSDVKLVSGLSDHCAVQATVRRTSG